MALLLYLPVTIAILALWSHRVQRVSLAMAIALIALPLLFTGRAMFTGRVYAPVDISFMAEPLHDYARDFGVETPYDIALSDLHCQIIPWQKAVRHSLAQGEWPLWNPFILCGDILAAAAQPAVYDPFQLVALLIPLPDAVTFGATLTFFLAGFFTFAFARALGRGDVAALIAAAGFMFCGMMAFFVGWPLGRSWAFLPLVLFAVNRVIHERNLRATVILTLGFVLTIFAGHPESVLHVVAVGAVYGAFEIAFVRRVRPLLLAIASGIVALLLTAIYLLPFAEAAPQTLEHEIRTQLYAKESYDRLAKPEVRAARMERTFTPHYRGQPGEDPLSARVGPAILLLAVIGIIANLRRRETWFFVALALICLGATFGAWPVAHALHSLPLFDIAINERLAFAAAFAMSMLAALGVDRMPRRAAVVILALVLVQRSLEDGAIYPALDRKTFYPKVPLIEAIEPGDRIVGLWFAFTPNNSALYELEDVRGYEAITNKRLYETYVLWSQYQTAWFNRVDDLSRPFLSFLNVRYALARTDPPDGWRIVAEDRGTRLLENTRALPRAFIPHRVRYERDGKNVIEGMKSASDFSERAWIEAPQFDPHEIVNGPGRVTLRRSGLSYEMTVEMERDGWVVISATAWNGWRAYLDGSRVRPHFANHAFLGVHVPQGKHHLRLRYLPQSFTRGRTITFVTIVVLLVGYATWRRFGRRTTRTFALVPPPQKN